MSILDFLTKNRTLFVSIVVIPFLVSGFYYWGMASDIYISESRFVVRQPDKKSLSGLGMFLQSAGITSARDETFTVRDFMLSRDALALIEEDLDLRERYSRPEIDYFSRFDPLSTDNSFEALFAYYLEHVTVKIDVASSIVVCKVRAYSAEDAHTINTRLLSLSETLINTLNNRARKDMIRFALREVEEAEVAAKASALAFSAYREQETLFDPTQQSTLQLQQAYKMQAELIEVRGQLAQLRSLATESPRIRSLEQRYTELQREINEATAKLTGGSESITQKVIEFERLALDRQFSEKRLSGALATLEQARTEAQRQQLYLETIVTPNLPDSTIYPRRTRAVITVLMACLLFYGIAFILLAGVKEHKK